MAIIIRKVGDLFEAEVTPPHGKGNHWQTAKPISAKKLVSELLEQGCHQTDIGDAFYSADPDWLANL